MKHLAIILTLSISIHSFSQTAKPTVKKTSPPKSTTSTQTPPPPKKSLDDRIIEGAQEWFKTFYVQLNFKDPYSYKPLNTKFRFVTLEEKFKEDSEMLSRSIPLLERQADSTNSLFVMYKEFAQDNYEKSINKKESKTMQEIYQKSYERYSQNVIEERAKIEKARNDLNETLQTINLVSLALSSMDAKRKASLGYYRIYHDCHANNSYGGQVLGRYTFKYDIETSLGSDVLKLND